MRRARRCKGDEALLEGPHLIRDAVSAGVALESVLATPDFLASPEGRDLSGLLSAAPEAVADDALASVLDSDSPRGVAALARLPRTGVAALPRREDGVYVYLDGLQDPGNLGALVRSAEAAGATAVALSPGCAHPNHPRALRASAGSLLRVALGVGVEAAGLERHLGDLGARWVALEARGGEDLWTVGLEGALVLALGAEGPGLSGEVAGRCGVRVTIGLDGGVESLNAAVAGALVLFEIRRRRLGGGGDGAGVKAGTGTEKKMRRE